MIDQEIIEAPFARSEKNSRTVTLEVAHEKEIE